MDLQDWQHAGLTSTSRSGAPLRQWPKSPNLLFGRHFKTQLLWVALLHPPHSRLSRNIMREICRYLGDYLIVPAVKGSSMTVYSLYDWKSTHCELQHSFSNASVPCLLNAREVLYVGSYPLYSPQIFVVSLDTFEVEEWPPMATARGWPGVIRLDTTVYVFGGNNPMLTSCEKLNVASRQWANLPNMGQPRYSFTPCLFEEEIYLADLMQTERVMEAFNPISETYRPISVQFPPSNRHAVSFILDDEYYIIDLDFVIARWKINSEERAFRLSKASNVDYLQNKPYCGSPPLILDKQVFFANYLTGSLVVFDVEKQGFVRSFD